MKNPFAPRGSWTVKAKPRGYVWQPDEVDHDLWHEIIDTYGLPAWIRCYCERRQPVTPGIDRAEIYVENALHSTVTTERMCELTHTLWVPIAYATRDVVISITRDRRTRSVILAEFYGYYASDFTVEDLLQPDAIDSCGPGSALTDTYEASRIVELPQFLYL